MDARIVTSEDAVATLRDLFDWADEVELAYAWASTAGGKALHWKAMDLAKIRRAVIGTQFAQTEPWTLTELHDKAQALRVVITSEGTFHPKLTWAKKGAGYRALIGSSNLTVGGFGANTEINVLIEGNAADAQGLAIREFFESAWEQGEELDPAWLAKYEVAHCNRPRSGGIVPSAPIEGETLASLEMPWSTYVNVLRNSEGAHLKNGNRLRLLGQTGSYFWELDQAQAIFARNLRFADLPSAEQRLVLGLGATTGYFGHMGASLATSMAVRDRAGEIGDVLDAVPLAGEVYEEAESYVRRLMEIRGFGLAVATRVLCVKRPDVFVSVNEANRDAFERLGYSVGKSVMRYLGLLRAVWGTSWYKSDEPGDPAEQRLWRARAAILDAAVYRG